MAIWEKLNPRERLEVIGGGVIVLGYLVGLTNFGIGGSVLALLAAIAIAVILYVKSAPNMNVAWPVDPALLNLAISALAALFVLIGFLSWIGFLGIYGGLTVVALLLTVAGTAIMVWGAWQEYQIVKPPMPAWMNSTSSSGSSGTSTSTPPSAPAAPPPPPVASSDQSWAPPSTPPPAGPVDDSEETPPG